MGVDGGGREDRHRAVGLADEQLDLGAAEDDALSAGRRQPADHLPVGAPGPRAAHAEAELLVDDLVHDPPVGLAGDQHRQAVGGMRCW
jgi:hypothetical protein